jgi:hypothetical protein
VTIRRKLTDSGHVRLTCTACNSEIVVAPTREAKVRAEHKTNCPRSTR